MNEVLSVQKKKTPFKLIVLYISLTIVLATLGFLIFSFRDSIKALISPPPEEVYDPVTGINPFKESPPSPDSDPSTEAPLAIPDSQKNCEYYSCVDLKKGPPTLDEVSECVAKYSEFNTPDSSYIEDAAGAMGVVESISPAGLSITFSGGKTLSVSSVTTVTIGGYSFNDTLFKGSRMLEYDIGEILSVIKPGDLVVLNGKDGVFSSLGLRCYVE